MPCSKNRSFLTELLYPNVVAVKAAYKYQSLFAVKVQKGMPLQTSDLYCYMTKLQLLYGGSATTTLGVIREQSRLVFVSKGYW